MSHPLVDQLLEETLAELDTDFIKEVNARLGHGADLSLMEKIAKMEGAAAAESAMTIPFEMLPQALFIKGPKYKVEFEKLYQQHPLGKDEGSWGKSPLEAVMKSVGVPSSLPTGWPSPEAADLPEAKSANFFAYEKLGASVGNTAGLAKIKFVDEMADVPTHVYEKVVDGFLADPKNGEWHHAMAFVGTTKDGDSIFQNSWGGGQHYVKGEAKASAHVDHLEAMVYAMAAAAACNSHKQKAVDPPVAVVECGGKVIYLPEPPSVTLSLRRPRALLVG